MKCESCNINEIEVEETTEEGQNPYRLCRPCQQRLINKSLRPVEYFNLTAIHGHNYYLQDNFYENETGEATFEREFVEAEQAAYWETCVEDDEIALRMDAGRRALMERGDDEVGPYQSPMEDGMQQFHEWYRRAMAHRLKVRPHSAQG